MKTEHTSLSLLLTVEERLTFLIALTLDVSTQVRSDRDYSGAPLVCLSCLAVEPEGQATFSRCSVCKLAPYCSKYASALLRATTSELRTLHPGSNAALPLS